MKQFDLYAYWTSGSERGVVTRDGRKVRIIATDRKGECPVVALVPHGDKEELVHSYHNDGTLYKDTPSPLDLFFEPQEVTRWVNMYDNSIAGEIISNTTYESEGEAIANCDIDKSDFCDSNVTYVRTAKITWEE